MMFMLMTIDYDQDDNVGSGFYDDYEDYDKDNENNYYYDNDSDKADDDENDNFDDKQGRDCSLKRREWIL